MDISIQPVSASQLVHPSQTPALSAGPFSPSLKTDEPSSPAQTAGEAREEAVRKASLSFKDTYAVSDKSFAIFKDASGQYITRYVSLRDGSVVYVPEPVLIRHAQAIGGNIVGGTQLAIHA